MGADITFVLGRAGAGKSAYLFDRAQGLAASGRMLFYVVPEQFTFETERALCERLGGLLDITVCSFTTLARRVLKESGERRVFLSRQGRRMVIRKCAEDHANELTAFALVHEKQGFSEKCDEFFTACKRFDIPPDALSAAAEKLPDTSPLRAKIRDLSLIYAAAEAHLAGRNMDAEDAFAALCACLPGSSVAGAEVMIDGFDLISEQLYDIIASLMDVASHITVALRTDASSRCRDSAVFTAETRVLERLRGIALEKRRTAEYVYLPERDAGSRYSSAALAHLEHEAFAYPFVPFSGDSRGAVRLFAGTDIRAEAEYAADTVLSLADSGMRYRDMAVIAADLEKYIEPVSRALKKRGIPFFTDAKHPLSLYPAAVLVLAAQRAAMRSYPARELLAVAKTGLAGVDKRETEEFENYILAHNLRGGMFTKPFPASAPEAAEEARRKLMEPLSALRAGLSAQRTAAGKAAALYEYMQAVSLRERLVALTDELRLAGRLELMEETAQVYNMLLELISQLHAIMGDTPLSTARFIDIFEEGVSTYEVGVIPTTADQLLLGSLGRSRARPLRALIVLGAVQGMFPASVNDDGMINDEEIRLLSSAGLTELPDTLSRADKELADVYGAVTKPSDMLLISYPLTGRDSAPCSLADRIRALFGDVHTATDIEPAPPVSPESALERLAGELRAGYDGGGMSDRTRALYAAFASRGGDEPWRERLSRIERALAYSSSPEPFGEELARMLYGDTVYGSATRLETFNACPFKHFARYALMLSPRREYRERAADEGIFCHETLCAFTQKLVECGKSPSLITDEETDAMLFEVAPPIAAAHNNGVFFDTARGRAMYERLMRKIRMTAHAVVRQLASGSFVPEGCEVAFGFGRAYPPLVLELAHGRRCILSGRIDRIDGFESEAGDKYIRIIDYKTGTSGFSFGDLAMGLKLQLPLYITALTAVNRTEEAVARAAGMYYQCVAEPAVAPGDRESVEAMLMKQFRLSGLSVKDAELLEAGGAGTAMPGIRSGRTVDAAAFEAARSYAVEKARETAEAITSGVADAAPARYSAKRTECKYCDYATVCGFDPALPGCVYKSVPGMRAKDFFGKVQNDDKVDE